VLGDIFGSVVPRSNASVVLIGTPQRSDRTFGPADQDARGAKGVSTAAEYGWSRRK
jgi:hypothetical protein